MIQERKVLPSSSLILPTYFKTGSPRRRTRGEVLAPLLTKKAKDKKIADGNTKQRMVVQSSALRLNMSYEKFLLYKKI